jgi:Protein phosphatase 2C
LPTWKFLNESVEGTSHRAAETQCQDSSFVTSFRFETDSGLILACSDGAGSAVESKIGSRLACETAVQQAMAFLDGGHAIAEVTPDILRGWAQQVHDAIQAEANRRGLIGRDLACTLLLSVIGHDAAAFVQIGDGAIVVRVGEEYCPVFWPQAGEYQNTTFFVTDAKFEGNIQAEVRQGEIVEIAMFSDGLQMLALHYATKVAHQPFFSPLFEALRKSDDPHELIVPMRQWLDSPAVNGKTDDDKTLILATRLVRNGDTAV